MNLKKVALWRSLSRVAATDTRLDAAFLTELVKRGERQREEIETYRVKAAEIAFTE